MPAGDEVMRWADRAEEDYLLAVSALRRRQPLVYGATFHAQQCAEKYLKALLVLKGASFPRTHDLAALGVLCSHNGYILPVSEENLEILSAYAVEARYPGMQHSVEEAQSAVLIAKVLRAFVRKIIPSR
jgi:HEPN domain-containing protein